jgi:hypothetical protein|tara:strand:- start:529 stop:1278 length:750 start_codon:yes stop_codon:yes gene_type:complete
MKKTLLILFLSVSFLTQAQINHYWYLEVEDGERFESVMKDYFLKVAQHAVDNGKTFTGWSVWRKNWRTNTHKYNYIIAVSTKNIEDLTSPWDWNPVEATGVAQEYIDVDWEVFRRDTYRVDSFVPGSFEYIVVNYSKPDDLAKQLAYEVDYITPVMKELISKKAYGRSGWNVQHKIYPSSSNEKYTMMTVDGYPTWTAAVKSFDSEYGVDNYATWSKALKKVHGSKTMKASTNNSFGYRPIYKRIVSTK